MKDQRNRFDEKSSHMLYEACSNFSTPGGGRCAGCMVVVQMHDNEMGGVKINIGSRVTMNIILSPKKPSGCLAFT